MKIDNILFIDIETVSQKKTFQDLDSKFQEIWMKKWKNSALLNQLSIEEAYEQKAAIFAEYSKIVCISIAYYHTKNDEYRLTSFANENELVLLTEFNTFLESLKKNYIFCGHNIKEFDIPFLCRRFLVNNISIPKLLNFQDKKPWEIEMIDTMQFWRFGDYKNFTSLDTLTTIFDIPSPKVNMDGSQVGHCFWVENDLPKIVDYCQNDVIALIHLYQKLNQKELVSPEKIKLISMPNE